MSITSACDILQLDAICQSSSSLVKKEEEVKK